MSTSQLTFSRHEYRMKAWYRSILLIFGAFAVSGALVMGFLASKASRLPLPYIMIAVFLFFGVYLISLAMRSRVIIDGNRIEIRGAFTDQYADLNEIDGYRTISSRNGNYTQFNLRGGRRPITLSFISKETRPSINGWRRSLISTSATAIESLKKSPSRKISAQLPRNVSPLSPRPKPTASSP